MLKHRQNFILLLPNSSMVMLRRLYSILHRRPLYMQSDFTRARTSDASHVRVLYMVPLTARSGSCPTVNATYDLTDGTEHNLEAQLQPERLPSGCLDIPRDEFSPS